MLTPPQVAKLLAVKAEKVRAWIATGELKAIDTARVRGSRPRYRIAEADLEAFKQGRAVIARPPMVRRPRKRPDDLPDYYGMMMRGERISVS